MQQLKTNRGLFMYCLLSVITFGIYPLYYLHRLSVELNLACSDDGKKTSGLIVYLLLTLVTFGIYAIIYWCLAVNRMHDFCLKNNVTPRLSVASYLLWSIVGSLLFGLGPLIAMYKFIHMHNDVNGIYNAKVLNATAK